MVILIIAIMAIIAIIVLLIMVAGKSNGDTEDLVSNDIKEYSIYELQVGMTINIHQLDSTLKTPIVLRKDPMDSSGVPGGEIVYIGKDYERYLGDDNFFIIKPSKLDDYDPATYIDTDF